MHRGARQRTLEGVPGGTLGLQVQGVEPAGECYGCGAVGEELAQGALKGLRPGQRVRSARDVEGLQGLVKGIGGFHIEEYPTDRQSRKGVF